MMTRECNDIGVDTIEAGNTIAVAMEGGLLKFGDEKGALKTSMKSARVPPWAEFLDKGVEATAKLLVSAGTGGKTPILCRRMSPVL